MKTNGQLSRRDFIKISAAAGAGATLSGCATNPVTGESQFMLISEAGEINLDQQNSPHQLSADYGTVQDNALNRYLNDLGSHMAAKTHRPNMPYSFHAVNAAYVNAYAFPGGSIAFTRGILLSMESEDELAAVMGHELGHVNARHTASRMSTGMLVNAMVAGVTIYMELEHEEYAGLAAGLGGIGAGLLLARYSRKDERQADSLGMQYMTDSGYNPRGMVDMMDMLRSLHDRQPTVIERMFSSHPMSQERYDTAVQETQTNYAGFTDRKYRKEKYMDLTAGIRKLRPTIEALQRGDQYLYKGKPQQALQQYKAAVDKGPRDYCALLMTANCCMALNRKDEARQYAERAKAVYPEEPQAHHVLGMVSLHGNRFGEAHQHFESYKGMLPGNPNTLFYNGLALEGMGRKEASAQEYAQYLQTVQQGDAAQHAYTRLVDWGYVQPAQ